MPRGVGWERHPRNRNVYFLFLLCGLCYALLSQQKGMLLLHSPANENRLPSHVIDLCGGNLSPVHDAIRQADFHFHGGNLQAVKQSRNGTKEQRSIEELNQHKYAFSSSPGSSHPSTARSSFAKKITGFANFKYIEVAMSWYERLEELGYTEHVIIATDKESSQFLSRPEHQRYRYEFLELKEFATTEGRAESLRMFAVRWHYILRELRNGVSILLTDVDNVFVRYVPLETFKPWDVIFAYAAYPPKPTLGFSVCGGMTWLAATNATIAYVERIVAVCAASCDDQVEINKLLTFSLNVTWDQPTLTTYDVQHSGGYFKDRPSTTRTGRSQETGISFKIWSTDFAYRGPLYPDVCPGPDNWVAMPHNKPGLRRKTVQKFKLSLPTLWNETCGLGSSERPVGLALHAEMGKLYRTQCLENTMRNLPIGPGRGKRNAGETISGVFAHHYDAGNDALWNQDIRFEPLPQLQITEKPCFVWEVGAHTHAADSRRLMKSYGHCEYHAYEPVPNYFTKLSKVWEGNTRMHLHNYGLARTSSTLHMDDSQLAKQSTFIGEPNRGTIPITITSLDEALQDAGGNFPTLVEMNCEGCEWTLLPDMVESGFFKEVAVLQVGFHNYGGGGLGQRAEELCRIHDMLRRTHSLEKGIPFAWERWTKNS